MTLLDLDDVTARLAGERLLPRLSRARVRAAIAAVVDHVNHGRGTEAAEALRGVGRAGGSSRLQERLRGLVNDALAPRQQELTSHGITTPFRYWTPAQKRRFIDHANAVVAALTEDVSPRVCVAYGCALGIARTGGFIPHDDDLDLLVGVPRARFPTFADAADFVVARLEARGYRIERVEAVPNLLHVHGGHHVDVFIGLEEGPWISSFPGPRRAVRIDDLFPAVMTEVEGGLLPVPRQPEVYARIIFGDDWREPQPGWTHDWNIHNRYADFLRGDEPGTRPRPHTARR